MYDIIILKKKKKEQLVLLHFLLLFKNSNRTEIEIEIKFYILIKFTISKQPKLCLVYDFLNSFSGF